MIQSEECRSLGATTVLNTDILPRKKRRRRLENLLGLCITLLQASKNETMTMAVCKTSKLYHFCTAFGNMERLAEACMENPRQYSKRSQA